MSVGYSYAIENLPDLLPSVWLTDPNGPIAPPGLWERWEPRYQGRGAPGYLRHSVARKEVGKGGKCQVPLWQSGDVLWSPASHHEKSEYCQAPSQELDGAGDFRKEDPAP